jgi:hypothetical protein
MSRYALVLTIVLCLIVVGVVLAQTQTAPLTTYVLRRGVMGSTSAETLEGDNHRLSAIVGQPVVGVSGAAGVYSLRHGYPQPFVPDGFGIYLPLIMKQ